MPETTITGLPNATTPLSGSERVPMDQAGTTKDATTQDIANLAPGTNLSFTQSTRTLASSTGDDVVLPLATDSLPGLMTAADKLRIDQLGADDSPSFAGLTITGTAAVTIPHIHGDIAGAVYIHVKNTSAGTLAKGSPVYATGTVGDTTTLEVAGADSSSGSFLPAVGLLAEALAPNASGHAVIAGELTGLSTAAYAIGDALYVASGGGLTATRPTTGTIQQVAIVGRVNSATGSVTVTISTELNPAWDTNTGDVTLAASVADVLSLSGQELQADDPGGDRLLFWDDSESRLRHLSLGPGVTIIGTTIYGEYVLGLACSDETSLLTTGTAKITFRMPFPADLFGVRANLTEAPTGSALVVDINENGVSVLSTKLSIDAGEETSVTAATPAVISDAALADDAKITADIDQIGSTTAGKGLKLWLYLRRTG